jgi:hypothetical protein
MNCNRCGSPNTREKWITAKTGKQYKVYECLNGCKKEGTDYNYSFFPPKDGSSQPATAADATEARAKALIAAASCPFTEKDRFWTTVDEFKEYILTGKKPVSRISEADKERLNNVTAQCQAPKGDEIPF